MLQQVKHEIYPTMRNYTGDLDICGTIPEIKKLAIAWFLKAFNEPG